MIGSALCTLTSSASTSESPCREIASVRPLKWTGIAIGFAPARGGTGARRSIQPGRHLARREAVLPVDRVRHEQGEVPRRIAVTDLCVDERAVRVPDVRRVATERRERREDAPISAEHGAEAEQVSVPLDQHDAAPHPIERRWGRRPRVGGTLATGGRGRVYRRHAGRGRGRRASGRVAVGGWERGKVAGLRRGGSKDSGGEREDGGGFSHEQHCNPCECARDLP